MLDELVFGEVREEQTVGDVLFVEVHEPERADDPQEYIEQQESHHGYLVLQLGFYAIP